jgi:nucleotide-binding universal stress UspA family protein
LREWAGSNLYDVETRCAVEAAESRLESILQEAPLHDLIIMTAARRTGIKRKFFGSLANSVVHNCRNPVFVVYFPKNEQSMVLQ